jgi:hypothetical protein
MPTIAPRRSLVAVATATLALAGPLAFDVALSHSASHPRDTTSAMVDTTTRFGHACAAPPSYGWPVRPFHRPHAIRGAFGDPRVGLAPAGVGLTHSFHTGVDVVAADGTPVYATLTGSVLLDPKNPFVVWVRDGHGTTFSYWHVVPAVHSGEHATRYQTVVGHVQKPWGHVHFAEIHDGVFLNPLRPDAMGPYSDRTVPEVTAVTLEHDARAVPLDRAHGSLDIVAQVDDPPAHPIAPPWGGLSVMPAEVRWRVTGPRGAGTRWATAVDYTKTIPDGASFGLVYAQWTRQNHPDQPGRYRVYLSHALSTDKLPNGLYRVEVEASDLCGNRSTSSAWLSLENGSPS